MSDNIEQINFRSLYSKKARLALRLNGVGSKILIVSIFVFGLMALLLFVIKMNRLGYLSLGLSLLGFIIFIWFKEDLSVIQPKDETFGSRLSKDVIGRLTDKDLTPQAVWRILSVDWQTKFFTNRLLINSSDIEQNLSSNANDMLQVWTEALRLAGNRPVIETGDVIASLLLTSIPLTELFNRANISKEDIQAVLSWVIRVVDSSSAAKPYFGGIGREWTTGFTPNLTKYGQNLTLSIEQSGSHFDWLQKTQGVTAVKEALTNGATAIALVGPPGIGKTSYVYALSKELLEEPNNKNLINTQIVSINPSMILSNIKKSSDIEQLLVTILREADHAGHIILFFDDAQLFFHEGVGSFDITQFLIPFLHDTQLRFLFAMSPNDFQALKAANTAFASLITPIVLREFEEDSVMRVLEDTVLGLEYRHHLLISYEALHEVYRLSGRYEQEIAYPGKAIQLLEQSLPYANHDVVMAESVQKAIENTRGIIAGSAKPVEANELLNLEAEIHERMINQSRAVHVVASALRRNRAGVANPNRPIGSFLFLGPTGVGKTELAKSIAATYFKNESNLVRLDMSEYQQPDDVKRLLDGASSSTSSLIMSVRQRPFSVVLLDEVEKAHPNVLNLLLQLLDEGQLTDNNGRAASFKNCIIIVTSNAAAQEIREHIEKGEALESFEQTFIEGLFSGGLFKPELLNRFDEIVLFRPLNKDELGQIVGLMMKEVNSTLSSQNISVDLTPSAIDKIVSKGYDERLGARPMRRVLQGSVEDLVANRILSGEVKSGDRLTIDSKDLLEQ